MPVEFRESDTKKAVASGLNLIEAYGDGGFRVAGRRLTGSLFLAPGRLEALAVETFADLSAEALLPLIESEVEILLVGTGESLEFLATPLRQRLEGCVAGVDVMDTGAAARTYNVLALEGRRVAAVLIAVG